MGFTGSLILARTPLPVTDQGVLAGLEVQFIGRRADHWQLAAVVTEHAPDTRGWAAALVNATAAPC